MSLVSLGRATRAGMGRRGTGAAPFAFAEGRARASRGDVREWLFWKWLPMAASPGLRRDAPRTPARGAGSPKPPRSGRSASTKRRNTSPGSGGGQADAFAAAERPRASEGADMEISRG